jgi:hypothetical protein
VVYVPVNQLESIGSGAGASVVTDIGADVGAKVDCVVGASVGDRVGAAVGANVGASVTSDAGVGAITGTVDGIGSSTPPSVHHTPLPPEQELQFASELAHHEPGAAKESG